MKRAIVLCGLLCLASLVWGADRSLLDQADAAFNQGRYDEAIAGIAPYPCRAHEYQSLPPSGARLCGKRTV